MLVKCLEFKTKNGQKVKIVDIPVLPLKSPLYFKVNVKLHAFLAEMDFDSKSKTIYSFREYLRKTLKWTEYDYLYNDKELKNNA
ncbi:DUF2535 family protein [Heyndrickxia sporothermodurans]